MLDEPKGNKATHGYATGGWVAAPAVGRIVKRVAPLLRRRAGGRCGAGAARADVHQRGGAVTPAWPTRVQGKDVRVRKLIQADPTVRESARRTIPRSPACTADSRAVQAGYPVRGPARQRAPTAAASSPRRVKRGAVAVLAPSRRCRRRPTVTRSTARQSAPPPGAAGRALLRPPAGDRRRGHRHQRQDLGRRISRASSGCCSASRRRASARWAWSPRLSTARRADHARPGRAASPISPSSPRRRRASGDGGVEPRPRPVPPRRRAASRPPPSPTSPATISTTTATWPPTSPPSGACSATCWRPAASRC